MGEITVLISHALSLKLKINDDPWALYQTTSLPKFKFKSKLYPKPPHLKPNPSIPPSSQNSLYNCYKQFFMKIKLFPTFVFMQS